MKITVNELFSGIGAQVAALRRIGVSYNVVGISEIDKFAIKSYEAINGQTRNYGDICKVESLDYADLWTYSFPCQDLSIAGKQQGLNGTRSGLLREVERLLKTAISEGKSPKYLLLENVKNLVGKKFKQDFDNWLSTLNTLGYNNYWKVLNAKDYGVPQNRERVFVVSIRKDLNQTYVFQEPVPLKTRLKDLLEPEVDEKYYLPREKMEKLVFNLNKDVSNTIRCGGGGSLDGKHTWDVVPINTCADGSCQALTAHLHKETANDCTKFECHLPATEVLKIRANTKKGYYIAKEGDSINLEQPNSTTRRGRVGKGKAQTLTTSCNQGVVENIRIRKLTPKECWRLMDFTDKEFELAKSSGVSNSQLYKQAGNSIVVGVLAKIFERLFKNESL